MIFQVQDFRKYMKGAIEAFETADGIEMTRFTAFQRRYFQQPGNEMQLKRSHGDAGIRLDFISDAKKIRMAFHITPGSARYVCFIDVIEDGVIVKNQGTFDYSKAPDGELEYSADGKEHRFQIVFPNMAHLTFKRFELEGASVLKASPAQKKLLCFGDSITQGYTTQFASASYPSLLAEYLGCELYNKGIGGEKFCPGILGEPDPFIPELITVAYGTNDWNGATREETALKSSEFFRRLTVLYPGTKICALLPLWRPDWENATAFGNYDAIKDVIRESCRPYADVRVIQPEIPHDLAILEDKYVHPNDLGAHFMAKSIFEKIR